MRSTYTTMSGIKPRRLIICFKVVASPKVFLRENKKAENDIPISFSAFLLDIFFVKVTKR